MVRSVDRGRLHRGARTRSTIHAPPPAACPPRVRSSVSGMAVWRCLRTEPFSFLQMLPVHATAVPLALVGRLGSGRGRRETWGCLAHETWRVQISALVQLQGTNSDTTVNSLARPRAPRADQENMYGCFCGPARGSREHVRLFLRCPAWRCRRGGGRVPPSTLVRRWTPGRSCTLPPTSQSHPCMYHALACVTDPT